MAKVSHALVETAGHIYECFNVDIHLIPKIGAAVRKTANYDPAGSGPWG